MSVLYDNFSSKFPLKNQTLINWGRHLLIVILFAFPFGLISSMFSILFFDDFNYYFIIPVILILDALFIVVLRLQEGLFIINEDNIEAFRTFDKIKTKEIPTNNVYKITYTYSKFRNYNKIKFLHINYKHKGKSGKFRVQVQDLSTEKLKEIIDLFYNKGAIFQIDSAEYEKDKILFPKAMVEKLKDRVKKNKNR